MSYRYILVWYLVKHRDNFTFTLHKHAGRLLECTKFNRHQCSQILKLRTNRGYDFPLISLFSALYTKSA